MQLTAAPIVVMWPVGSQNHINNIIYTSACRGRTPQKTPFKQGRNDTMIILHHPYIWNLFQPRTLYSRLHGELAYFQTVKDCSFLLNINSQHNSSSLYTASITDSLMLTLAGKAGRGSASSWSFVNHEKAVKQSFFFKSWEHAASSCTED